MYIDKEDKHFIQCFLDSEYPLTIISDRYSGAYSQGKFLAFPMEYDDIPQGPCLSDIPCGEFWSKEDTLPYFIGKGDTIQEAIDDLKKKYNKQLVCI